MAYIVRQKIKMTYEEAHRAIKHGDVLRLSASIPHLLSASSTNRLGWSLLMLAALQGDTAVGRFLIRSGAELDRRNDFGETALSLAAHKGHVKFIELLITSGAVDLGLPHGRTVDVFLREAAGLPDAVLSSVLAALQTITQAEQVETQQPPLAALSATSPVS
jgi:ankyrin repeat protein